MVDQRLEILADGPELLRADVQRLPGSGAFARREQDRVDEILDREQLVPVGAVTQCVDPTAVADPVEEDLEDAEPFGPDERLRAQDHAVQAAPHERADRVLGLDLGLAVVADAVERVILLDRVLVRHAVDSGGDEHDAPHAGLGGGRKQGQRAVDVDGLDLRPRSADRKRGRGVHEDPRALNELARRRFVTDVPSELANLSFELRVVQADEVERPHLVPVGEEPTGEVQPEKSGSAADGPDHRARLTAGDTSQ